MIIIRSADGSEPVVVVRRAAAQDVRLSIRARGLLALLGWGATELEGAVRANDWRNAGAGAVVAWLREITRPPAVADVPRPRPEWCGIEAKWHPRQAGELVHLRPHPWTLAHAVGAAAVAVTAELGIDLGDWIGPEHAPGLLAVAALLESWSHSSGKP